MRQAYLAMGLLVTASLGSVGCGSDGDPCAGVVGVCIPLPRGTEQSDVVRAFVEAEAGQTIAFGKGTFEFDRGLELNPVPGVTVRGQGIDETILSFAATDMGHGIFVGAGGDNFTIHDLTIQDTRQNGIEVRGTTGIVFRRIKVEWTTDPATVNPDDLENEVGSPFGRYAIYPTSCNHLLIEHSIARRASDAGIYVGSCNDAILRYNVAEENVSGLQVENTLRADVYGNVAQNNVLGMLVHDLPNQPVNANGDQTRVFENEFIENNFVNFSLATDLTSNVPTGSGMAILARGRVDIYDNLIADNNTVNMTIVSFLMIEPAFGGAGDYYPYPDTIQLRGNTFRGGGTSPEISRRGNIVPLGLMLNMVRLNQPDQRVPDVVYDGFLDPDVAAANPGDPNPMQICLGDPPNGTFLNLQADADKLAEAFQNDDPTPLVDGVDTDDTAFRCTLGAADGFPLPAVNVTVDG
jgi:parallel beta-helix repeat protein